MGKGTPQERYEAKIDRSAGPDRCHPWTAARSRGYGTFNPAGRTMSAHRFGYRLYIGPIPDGRTIDHTCHNGSGCQLADGCPHRACQNPDHWEVVTHQVNISRGTSREVNLRRKRAITHCPQGHEYTPENTTYSRAGTSRGCRACARIRARASSSPRLACKRGHPYPEATTTPGRNRQCAMCKDLTVCVNGHPRAPGGGRCLPCARIRTARYRERRSALAL